MFYTGVLLALGVGLFIDSVAHASTPPKNRAAAQKKMKRVIRPSWSSVSVSKIKSNDSYLSTVGYVARERTLNDEVFGPDVTSADIASESQAYEVSKLRGTEHAQSEKGRFDRIRDYARRAINRISRFQLKSRFTHAKKHAKNMDSGAREPLAAAVIATSLYTGRTFNFKISDAIKVSSRAEIRDKHASVAMHLPGSISSQVEAQGGSGVNASVSKQITDQISASVGTRDRGTAQVNYSISF